MEGTQKHKENRQAPSSSVMVSTTSDNQLQLTGTVNSDSEKQRVEDIARTSAPGHTIISKIKVSTSSSDQTTPR